MAEQGLPAHHFYNPPSSSRPGMEYFVVFNRIGTFQLVSQHELRNHDVGFNFSSCTSIATIVDEYSGVNQLFKIAVSDFLDAQAMARKIMQTVWLRGCHVGALLLMEARRRAIFSKNPSSIAIFEHRLLLYVIFRFIVF